MLEKLKLIADHYDEINEKLMDPNVINDQNQYRDLMKEYKKPHPHRREVQGASKRLLTTSRKLNPCWRPAASTRPI